MPPMISTEESESEGLDSIPSRPTKKPRKEATPSEPEDEDEEEEGSDEEDGETFAVEKIVTHDFGPEGIVLYQVKWLGYEDEKDRTWEPAENLVEGAADILEEYHKKIGGPPTKAKAAAKGTPKGGRGKRKSAAIEDDSPAPAAGGGRGRQSKKAKANGSGWQMPVGSWEDAVRSIETISDDGNPSGSTGGLQVFMVFNDGHRTKFNMKLIRQKCPQKLLDYYEQHLSFRDPQPAAAVKNDDDDDEDEDEDEKSDAESGTQASDD